MNLKEVDIEDRAWVTDLMRRSAFRGSDYTFANLYNWSKAYTIHIGRLEDYVIIRSGQQVYNYLYPAGSGDVRPAMEAMEQESRAAGMPFLLYGICERAKQTMEELYPDRFVFKAIRDNFDYIYSRESLATLGGKKLHGKRNHVARFKENYPNWRYEAITDENLHEAWAMNVEWCRQNGCNETHSLQREACAVRSAFEHYRALGLVGGLLRDGQRVVAFTFGSAVTEDTFVVHVEKAFAEVQGAYPMINQQFVQRELSQYTYVNREDDLGEEGLRRAKESYRPEFMYERYTAREKEAE